MAKADIQRIKEERTVEEIARSLGIQLSRSLQAPCPRCGGADRFYIHRGRNFWACRQCHEKPGDIFELIEVVLGHGFADALKWLGETPAAPPPQEAKKLEYSWRDPQWQKRTRDLLGRAEAELARSQEAQAYLLGRGIARETWEAFRFGYTCFPDKETGVPIKAVLLPWIGAEGTITGIKYRKLAPVSKGDRFFYARGTEQVMFGGNFGKRHPRVAIVEGEFNAVSIWQALKGEDCDVLSFGGDRARRFLPDMLAVYSEALVWVDDPEVARGIHETFKATNASYMVSPDGWDANDILSSYGDEVLAELVRARLGIG